MQNSDIDVEILKEDARNALRLMVKARTADLKFSSLYKAGKITGGCHLGKGHEAVAASSGLYLKRGYDIYAPFIREQAGRLAFGETLLEAAQTYLGSVNGPMRGRDGNVHRGCPNEGLIVPISHLGATMAVVIGGLLAKRIKGELPGAIGIAHIGDGTTSTGAFHEAINAAAVEKLPFICVVTNNQFAYSTPNIREFACQSLVDKSIGYGIEGYEVDGTDLLATLALMKALTDRARAGEGPFLVVANVLRLCGHGEHDDAKYIPQDIKDSEVGRDCLSVAKTQLLELGWITPEELTEWEIEAAEEIQKAVAQAQREPTPNPFKEDWSTTFYNFDDLY